MIHMREIDLINRRLKKVYADAGGEEGLSKILTEFYKRMSHDLLIGFFFDGKDLAPIIAQQKSFLMRAMGAGNQYLGKSPARAHDKLAPILQGHFDRRLVILREVLKDFKLPAESIDTWVEFEATFRDGIVKEEGSR